MAIQTITAASPYRARLPLLFMATFFENIHTISEREVLEEQSAPNTSALLMPNGFVFNVSLNII